MAIDLPLPHGAVPIPRSPIEIQNDQQVLQFLDFRITAARGVGDDAVEIDRFANLRVPAIDETATQARIGRIELQYQIDSTGALERWIDQIDRAVRGEDVNDPLLRFDAVHRAEKYVLIVALRRQGAIAQSDVHVVEEDDAALGDLEELLDGFGGVARSAGFLIGVRSNDAVFETLAMTFLPEPATCRRLAVAGRTGEQQPAPRPTAEFANPCQIVAIEEAERVAAERVEDGVGQDGRGIDLGMLPPQSNDLAKQRQIVGARNDKEVVGEVVQIIRVFSDRAGQANAIDGVESNAKPNAGIVLRPTAVPLANEHAVERNQRAALGVLLDEVLKLIKKHDNGVKDLRSLRCGGNERSMIGRNLVQGQGHNSAAYWPRWISGMGKGQGEVCAGSRKTRANLRGPSPKPSGRKAGAGDTRQLRPIATRYRFCEFAAGGRRSGWIYSIRRQLAFFLSHFCFAGGCNGRESVNDPRPDSETTVQLLQRAGAGDRAALNQLLAEHRDELRAFVAGRLDAGIRARVDPSDVVQETLAEIVRRLPDFLRRKPMPFHLWVRKEAYERVLNTRRYHRAQCRNPGLEVPQPDDSSVSLVNSLVGNGATPSEEAQANELAQHVAQAIANLDEGDREILILRRVDKLPYEEVAVLLNVSVTAARQRFGRALLRLNDALSPYGFTGIDVS